jgi:benzylsuccinate CoA-transferase BbsF subunit
VHVDLAQLETLLAIGGDMLLATSVNGQVPVRRGNRSRQHAPQNVYRCAGDDRWVALTVTGDEQWGRLVDLIGDPSLIDLAGADAGQRRANAAGIDAAIARWTATMSPGDATTALQAIGVAAAPVMTNGDLVADPHLRERGFIAIIDQPDVGRRGFPGCPIHLSRTPVRLRPSPPLGEANRAIVGPLLGCDADDVAELERRNVLASSPLYR